MQISLILVGNFVCGIMQSPLICVGAPNVNLLNKTAQLWYFVPGFRSSPFPASRHFLILFPGRL